MTAPQESPDPVNSSPAPLRHWKRLVNLYQLECLGQFQTQSKTATEADIVGHWKIGQSENRVIKHWPIVQY